MNISDQPRIITRSLTKYANALENLSDAYEELKRDAEFGLRYLATKVPSTVHGSTIEKINRYNAELNMLGNVLFDAVESKEEGEALREFLQELHADAKNALTTLSNRRFVEAQDNN